MSEPSCVVAPESWAENPDLYLLKDVIERLSGGFVAGITPAVTLAIFSLILSFNETISIPIVQGGQNTVQTYLWSQYQRVGLSPRFYAVMTALIVLTFFLVAILAPAERRLSAKSG